MKKIIIIKFCILISISGFTRNLPDTLSIIDTTLSNSFAVFGFRYPDWLKNQAVLCSDSGIIHDNRTRQPFTGHVYLYNDSNSLFAELNLVDGKKDGWQVCYYGNGNPYMRYFYGKRLSWMEPWMDGYDRYHEYYENGNIKESHVLECDTIPLYKETTYYLSGHKSSEGYARFVKELILVGFGKAPTGTKRQRREASKALDKFNKEYPSFRITNFKTGHWMYYNKDGELVSEGDYEIIGNGEYALYEKRVGEWINYNRIRIALSDKDQDKEWSESIETIIVETTEGPHNNKKMRVLIYQDYNGPGVSTYYFGHHSAKFSRHHTRYPLKSGSYVLRDSVLTLDYGDRKETYVADQPASTSHLILKQDVTTRYQDRYPEAGITKVIIVRLWYGHTRLTFRDHMIF